MARAGIKIYVVHGHRCAFVSAVASYLESLGLHPIVLHDASRHDRSLVERFENFASQAYALVLLTPEPSDGSRRAPALERADPQLVFQLGYLVGKLGRRNVAALHQEDLELPAELTSVLTIPVDEIGLWKYGLSRDLMAAGFELAERPLASGA